MTHNFANDFLTWLKELPEEKLYEVKELIYDVEKDIKEKKERQAREALIIFLEEWDKKGVRFFIEKDEDDAEYDYLNPSFPTIYRIEVDY